MVFPCGFNSGSTKDALTFLAIYVVPQRGPPAYTDHWEEIKMTMTVRAEGRGAIHASHRSGALWFFKCKLRVWLDSQPPLQPQKHGISEMSACVKITSGLCCSHASMFLHKDRGARPCLCPRDRSAFVSDITLHRWGQVGVRGRKGGEQGEHVYSLNLECSFSKWPGGGWITELTAAGSPLLGSEVIRTDLWGVECLHELNSGQSGWRRCVL